MSSALASLKRGHGAPESTPSKARKLEAPLSLVKEKILFVTPNSAPVSESVDSVTAKRCLEPSFELKRVLRERSNSPLFPSLMQSLAPISSLPSLLKISTGLKHIFSARKILTVGQLSTMTEGEVQALPIRISPDTIRRALSDYYLLTYNENADGTSIKSDSLEQKPSTSCTNEQNKEENSPIINASSPALLDNSKTSGEHVATDCLPPLPLSPPSLLDRVPTMSQEGGEEGHLDGDMIPPSQDTCAHAEPIVPPPMHAPLTEPSQLTLQQAISFAKLRSKELESLDAPSLALLIADLSTLLHSAASRLHASTNS